MKHTIVIDTSAILAVLLGEAHKHRLEVAARGADLVAPASLRWEIGNALSAMFKKRILTLRESERVLQAFYEIPIQFVDVDISSALNICDEYGLYAYDAYMIVCARKRDAPLLTLDATLTQVAQKCLIKVLEIK